MTSKNRRRPVGLIVALALLVSGCGVAPTPSLPSAGSADPAGGIAPYPGWTELARLQPDDVLPNGVAIAAGDRQASSRFLLISAICTTGRLTITAPGPVDPTESTVECPALADPQRSIAFIGDDVASWEVRVVPNGVVDFEARIEGSDVPLHIPPIVLTAGDKSIELAGGCWAISLSWGYVASDQCGTTIPEQIQTIQVERGATASISIDGWEILQASALCGRLDRGAGQPDLFEAMPDCAVQATLDGGGVRLAGLRSAPEPWLVELGLVARAGWGDQFSGPFYAYVSVP
jgi:hypothetical protein